MNLQCPYLDSLNGMKFINVYDQMTDDTLLGFDSRPSVHPGAEMWVYNDPEFGVQRANPSNSVGGDAVPDYTGMHVNIVKEDEYPFGSTVQVWCHMLPTTKIGDVIMNGGSI